MPSKNPPKPKPVAIEIDMRSKLITKSVMFGGDGTSTRQLDPAPLLDAMQKLFHRFGIAPGDWMELSIRLALEGGFIRQKLPKGRSARWTPALYYALWCEVERWQAIHKPPSKKAIFANPDFLCLWRRKANSSDRSGSLEQRYYEAPDHSLLVRVGLMVQERHVTHRLDPGASIDLMATAAWDFVGLDKLSTTNRERG